jgi:MFS family permease
VLGKADGFSQGIERSYHYGYFEPEAGLAHVGMISHLGSMIPVAAGLIGGLMGAHFGWRAAFLISGIPGLLAAVAALRIRDPGRHADEAATASASWPEAIRAA